MAAILLEDVTKRYGEVRGLTGVSLAVEEGTFHCLVGANGSGKSTLLAAVVGLVRPTEGSVTVDGSVGIAFQEPSVFPDLTVAENVSVFADVAGQRDREWLATVRERLGLDDVWDRETGALSGGYRHRLDLALAVVGRPAVLLVDEPLADLDPPTRHDVYDFLSAYNADGNTVVVTTHRLGAFEAVLDRITVLRHGEVAYDGRLEDLGPDLDERLRDVVGHDGG